MALNNDQLFRRIWLINGILFLLLFIGTLVLGGLALLPDRNSWGVQATRKSEVAADSVRPRDIRYDKPAAVLNSQSTLVRVRYGTDYGEMSNGSSGLGSSHYERAYNPGPTVNVIFLPREGGPGRLLLDRPAYIQNLEFPGDRRDPEDRLKDSVPWITYAIAFEDTDQSGRMDYNDAAELYISDLDGGNLRRVLQPGFHVLSTEVLPGRELLVLALDGRGVKAKARDQLTQRAFRFNPRTNVLGPVPVLDSLAAKAGHILGRR
jgi:hypothetical protein